MDWKKALEVTKGTNKITCPNCLYGGCSTWGKTTYTKGKKYQRYRCCNCKKIFTFGVRKIFFDKGYELGNKKGTMEVHNR